MEKFSFKTIIITLSACLFSAGFVLAAPQQLQIVGTHTQTLSGCNFRLVGVDICGLEWQENGMGPPSGAGGDMTKSVAAAVNTWKCNIIRVPLDQDFWFGYDDGNSTSSGTQNTAYMNNYRTYVDSVVNSASAMNCYVELDLHWSGNGNWGSSTNVKQQTMPDAHSTQFWTDVATRYANNPAVIFNLYNEPYTTSWSIWKSGGTTSEGFTTPGFQALVKTVRDTGAKNIISVGGLGWAWDLTQASANKLTDTNTAGTLTGYGIMYEAHIYDNKGGSTESAKITLWNNNVTVAVAAGLCVMIGEFGPATDGSQDNSGCTPFESDLISWINGNNTSSYVYNAMGWCFHQGATPKLISDWNFTATTCHGAQVKAWLAAVTPSNCPAGTPSYTPTATPTMTRTNTPANTFTFTATRTNTPANTFTFTATRTFTPTFTFTPVNTSTFTATRTFTPTATPTATPTFTYTATQTFTPANTATFTATRTNTPVNTRTYTPTATRTNTPVNTATGTPINTSTNTPSNTATSTAVNTSTFTPVNTPTGSRTATPSFTVTRTSTATPVLSPTPTWTGTPLTSTATPTITQSFTGLPTDTATPSYTATPPDTATNTPVNTATNTPANTATNTPVNTYTSTPVNTATNTPVNTATNTPVNTSTATPVNTATRTPANTATNTPVNTSTATRTITRTATPTITQTIALPSATFTPTTAPTAQVYTIQNTYPIPSIYNASTGTGLTIAFTVSKDTAMVTFRLYTSGFRLVRMITETKFFPSGSDALPVEQKYLSSLSSGAYYYSIQSESMDGMKARAKTGLILIVR